MQSSSGFFYVLLFVEDPRGGIIRSTFSSAVTLNPFCDYLHAYLSGAVKETPLYIELRLPRQRFLISIRTNQLIDCASCRLGVNTLRSPRESIIKTRKIWTNKAHMLAPPPATVNPTAAPSAASSMAALQEWSLLRLMSSLR